ERESQQWQLLVQLPKVGNVIVGKGGINTMFYIYGDSPRELCLPDALFDVLDDWILRASIAKYLIKYKGKVVQKGIESETLAREVKVKQGSVLYKVEGGVRTKIAVYKKTLFGKQWEDVK